MRATSVIFKILSNANNHPLGESPNLSTLFLSDIAERQFFVCNVAERVIKKQGYFVRNILFLNIGMDNQFKSGFC
jgi:hypothetical protein